MKTSDTLAAISPALVKALSEMEGAAKTAANPHFRSKYANLEAVVDASRDVLAKHDLAVMQGAGHVLDGKLHLTTRILHASGEWIESEFSLPLAKPDPQATLAALTYARRGSLMAILGMPAVDDDGETAMGRGQAPAPEKPKSSYRAKQEGLGPRADALIHELRETIDEVELTQWGKDHADEIAGLADQWQKMIREEFAEQRIRLRASDMDAGFQGAVGPRSSGSGGVARNGSAVA